MKRFTTLLAATALSATLFAGVANADTLFNTQPVSQTVQMLKNDNFNIVVLQSQDNDFDNSYFADYVINPEIHRTDIADLQRAISANKPLKSALLAQNVQLNNVVAADRAADGSVTFYLR